MVRVDRSRPVKRLFQAVLQNKRLENKRLGLANGRTPWPGIARSTEEGRLYLLSMTLRDTLLNVLTQRARSKLAHLMICASIPYFLAAQAPEPEEIYVVRSVREGGGAPTEFCAKERIGFDGARAEARYTFRSAATRASDGRVTNTNVKTVGDIHACFGASSASFVYKFYGEGTLGGLAFKGIGECKGRPDFPEQGLNSTRCFLDLSNLPEQYLGGLLTTNTVLSRKSNGTETDPPGYTQSSLATVRLWKKR